MSETITLPKSPEQLLRDDIERQTLEAAARALEDRGPIGEAYRKAWKRAAQIIRDLKPR